MYSLREKTKRSTEIEKKHTTSCWKENGVLTNSCNRHLLHARTRLRTHERVEKQWYICNSPHAALPEKHTCESFESVCTLPLIHTHTHSKAKRLRVYVGRKTRIPTNTRNHTYHTDILTQTNELFTCLLSLPQVWKDTRTLALSTVPLPEQIRKHGKTANIYEYAWTFTWVQSDAPFTEGDHVINKPSSTSRPCPLAY